MSCIEYIDWTSKRTSMEWMQNSYWCGSIFGVSKSTPFHEPRPKLHESIGRQKKLLHFTKGSRARTFDVNNIFFLSPSKLQTAKSKLHILRCKKKNVFFLLFSLNFSTQILTNDKNEIFFFCFTEYAIWNFAKKKNLRLNQEHVRITKK